MGNRTRTKRAEPEPIKPWGPCTRCGHTWMPRKFDAHGHPVEPRCCASCRSAYWREPRTAPPRTPKTRMQAVRAAELIHRQSPQDRIAQGIGAPVTVPVFPAAPLLPPPPAMRSAATMPVPPKLDSQLRSTSLGLSPKLELVPSAKDDSGDGQ